MTFQVDFEGENKGIPTLWGIHDQTRDRDQSH